MAQTAQLRHLDAIENEAQRIFTLQRQAYKRHPYPTLEERLESLTKVERILVDNADAIDEAINKDFGHRASAESKMLELFTCVDGIRHTRKKLKKVMKPERRHVSVLFATGKKPSHPAAQGRRRPDLSLELPSLSDDQPAHQHPGSWQPVHDQDGPQLREPLPAPAREIP